MPERRLWTYERPVLEQTSGRDLQTLEEEGAGFLVRLVTPWKTHTGAGCSQRTHGTVTHIAAVYAELQPMGWIHIGEICGALPSMGGTSCWRQGKDSSPWTATEITCHQLMFIPIPHLPAPVDEVELENTQGWEKVFLMSNLILHWPALILLTTNSINLPNVCLVCPWWHLVSHLALSLSQLMNPSLSSYREKW